MKKIIILLALAMPIMAFSQPPVQVDGEDTSFYLVVDEMPRFGTETTDDFRRWVMNGIVYPQEVRDRCIQGSVVVSFIVEKSGEITHIEIVSSPNKTLSDVVVARISQSPRWEPAKTHGQPVRLKYTLPITFRLTE